MLNQPGLLTQFKYNMKCIRIFAALLLLISETALSQLVPADLTCEYLRDPSVIDIQKPRLSWINSDPQNIRGQMQTAWQIEVSATRKGLLKGDSELWNSGKIVSGESVNIQYAGKQIKSRQDCWWRVKVWDKAGKASKWSEPAFWSMGILTPGEWNAKWIGAPWYGEQPIPDKKRPLTASRAKSGQKVTDYVAADSSLVAPLLRKEFTIRKEVASAKAFVTGLGYFEFYINGKKVGNDVLVPNQTNYGKRPGLMNNAIPIEDNFREYRVMYLSYDIKGLISAGKNAAGAILGNGFYNAPINWTESYGTPRFLAQIYITYTDGTEDIIVSDQSWKASKSPILMNLVFDGEHYDASLEQEGWSSPGFNDSGWKNADLKNAPEGVLKAQMSYPDRVMERIDPVKIDRLGEGHYKVDFGQEISGWLKISGFSGRPGHRIDIKYLHKTPVGDNSYTLSGKGIESYAARFTWFVFREVEIFNWPGELKAGQLKAEAVYTYTETTGKFSCSNELFNEINRIWWRSQTDNMHGGIASDCPNRERSPYTGDGQVSCVTVMHNFDVRPFYTKWIRDIMGAQNINTGYVPNGAPWQPGCGGGVAWGAAICIMPWEFYIQYGDTSMLRDNYEGMKGYVRYMLTWTDSTGIMYSKVPGKDGKPNQWMNLGDWSQPDKLPPDEMVHTFYLWRCAGITAKAAEVLGNYKEFNKYSGIAAKTRLAFMTKYYDAAKGSYGQYGGNIFALKMGVPDDRKEKVIASLRSDIAANGGHLDTGIFGTQFFFEVLSENGMHDLAYEAMNKRSAPGYGWWLEQGSTTSWEGWEDPGSGNHPMFGGGIVWFYRKLAGMNANPAKPGYRNIIFRPQSAGDISFAEYSNRTPYGKGSIEWKKEKGEFKMSIEVPVGSTATVFVPVSGSGKVLEGGIEAGSSEGVVFERTGNGYSVFAVGSGQYNFTSIF
jgi:alpha-L-rhamnosidase